MPKINRGGGRWEDTTLAGAWPRIAPGVYRWEAKDERERLVWHCRYRAGISPWVQAYLTPAEVRELRKQRQVQVLHRLGEEGAGAAFYDAEEIDALTQTAEALEAGAPAVPAPGGADDDAAVQALRDLVAEDPASQPAPAPVLELPEPPAPPAAKVYRAGGWETVRLPGAFVPGPGGISRYEAFDPGQGQSVVLARYPGTISPWVDVYLTPAQIEQVLKVREVRILSQAGDGMPPEYVPVRDIGAMEVGQKLVDRAKAGAAGGYVPAVDQGPVSLPELPVPQGVICCPPLMAERGSEGPRGLKGDKGEKGDKGDLGPAGMNGARGADGVAGAAGPAPSGTGNLVLATPADGSSGTSSLRAIVAADLPATITGNTSLLSDIIDARTATTLAIGPTTATAISIGASGTSTTFLGNLLLNAGKGITFNAGSGAYNAGNATGATTLSTGSFSYTAASGKTITLAGDGYTQLTSASNTLLLSANTSNFRLNGGTGGTLEYGGSPVATIGSSALTMAANMGITFAAGTGAYNAGSATGDTTFGTGALGYAGASGKAISLVSTAAAVTLKSTTSGIVTVDSGGQLNLGTSTATTTSVGNSSNTTNINGAGGNVNFKSGGSTIFSLNTAVLSMAANAGITFAAGTGAFDLSAASGIFKTTTGLTSLLGGAQLLGAAPAAAADAVGEGIVDINGAGTAAPKSVYEGGATQVERVEGAGVLNVMHISRNFTDDETLALPAPSSGFHGILDISSDGDAGMVHADASGNTTSFMTVAGLTAVLTTDTDGRLCVYNNGGVPTLKNRLGGTKHLLGTYRWR